MTINWVEMLNIEADKSTDDWTSFNLSLKNTGSLLHFNCKSGLISLPVTHWHNTKCFETFKYLQNDSLMTQNRFSSSFLLVLHLTSRVIHHISSSSSHHQTTVHLDLSLSPPSKYCLNNLVNMSVFIHYPASHHDQASRFNEANRYFCSDCLALPQSIKTIKWTHLFLIRS